MHWPHDAEAGGLAVQVQALFVYPVKACAGLAVDALEFDAAGGVAGDREWAVLDREGAVTWQGSVPRLALVRPVPVPGGLRLQAPGLPELALPADEGAECEVRLWNEGTQRHEVFAARMAGAAAQAWLAQAAQADVRLVRLGPEARRRDSLNPVHLLSRASVAAVDARTRAAGGPPAAVERFRPNVLVDGPDLQAFDEDHLRCLRWPGAGLALQVLDRCVRCVVVNVDPRTAQVEDATLAAVAQLSAERRPGRPVSLGVYVRAQRRGRLSVGERGLAQLAF